MFIESTVGQAPAVADRRHRGTLTPGLGKGNSGSSGVGAEVVRSRRALKKPQESSRQRRHSGVW